MTRRAHPFDGEGEVRALGRPLDWAATPLGPVDAWSGTLRGAVRTALDSSFPISLWCGPDLVLIYNDAYTAVLGAKHPTSLGRPGTEVWAEIWDDIEPFFEQIRAGGPPVYKEDAPFVVRRAGVGAGQEALGSPPGTPNAWFTFSLSPVRDEAGEIVAFLNIVSETTGRIVAERAREAARSAAERAEARLRDVFAQAPAFMALLRGPDHVFEYVNTAYYRLVGSRDLLGRPLFEALPEVRGQGFEQLLDQVLVTGEPFVGREVPVMLASTAEDIPEEHFLDFVYYPITEADGTRSGVVAHGSDVTQHVRARREAQRARAEAEQANLAKSQFLATMSHEIRTPINAVLGYADLLDAGVAGSLTEDQQAYVDAIGSSGRHLRALVSDILDLAKVEAGEMEVASRHVVARSAVASALRLIEPQADRKGLTLSESWECEEGVQVIGDEDRIRQVLLNLLSNALKFTDEGGTIAVRCRTAEWPPAEAALPAVGPWFVIDVRDTGRGIPAADLDRMFEPFVQAEAGHTRQRGGTGLGLTISRRLARLMGGELTVESEPGEGSCFSLWLAPAVQERVQRTGRRVEPAEPWPPATEELPGLAATGRTLLSVVDQVEDAWVERLRTDPRIAVAERVSRAQLADQTAELVAAMAKALFVLEEGSGDPGLLQDAESIRSLVARRHAHQRRRLGWARGELEREFEILAEVLDATLRREAPRRTAANLATALRVVHRLVDRAKRESLGAFES
ncbi:MAG: ATP-binding protein [Gemmatimonadota bacterium]